MISYIRHIFNKNIYIRYIIYTFLSLSIFVLRRHKILLVLPIVLAAISVFVLKKKIYINKISIVYVLFWIYYILISIISYIIGNRQLDITKIATLIVNVLIIISIAILIPPTVRDKEKLLIYLRNFGIIMCFIGIIEFITKNSFFYNIILVEAKNWQFNLFGTDKFRIFTMFLHPIVYAMFLLTVFWINYYYREKNIYLFWIIQLLIVFNLYATQSRSSWIALIIIIIINKIISINEKDNKIQKSRKKHKIIAGFLIFILLVIFKERIIEIFINIYERFYLAFDITNSEGSRIQRLGAISNILRFCTDNIGLAFIGGGVGYNNIFMIKNPIYIGFEYVDNQYFSLILNCGIIGLVLFFSPIIMLLINKSFRKSKINKTLFLALLSIYICIFFYEGLSWHTTLFLNSIFIFMVTNKI